VVIDPTTTAPTDDRARALTSGMVLQVPPAFMTGLSSSTDPIRTILRYLHHNWSW
jgi:hypothetical protein